MSPVDRADQLLDRIATPQWVVRMAVAAALMAVVATASSTVAIVKVSAQAGRAERAARENCVRTMRFSPRLADAYQKYDILSPEQLRAYRETIPSTCQPAE